MPVSGVSSLMIKLHYKSNFQAYGAELLMKSRIALFGIVLSIAISGLVVAQEASDRPAHDVTPQPSIQLPAELDRVLRDYEKAWRDRDAEALAKLFTEDGFVLPNGEPPVRGRTAIAEYYDGHGGPLHLRGFAHSQSGDIAFILGGYATAAGGPDVGKFTLTLHKQDEKWFIFSDMDNGNRRPRTTGND